MIVMIAGGALIAAGVVLLLGLAVAEVVAPVCVDPWDEPHRDVVPWPDQPASSTVLVRPAA